MDTNNPNFLEENTFNPQVLFAWKAPLRPFKKRGKNILRFYVALAFLLSLIVFFFGDRILLIPIWAVLFLFYVLTITPPPEVENKITKFGVETTGITLRWEVLSHFYFSERFNYTMLTIVSQPPYNLHTYMVIPSVQIKERVKILLAEHLVYQDKPQRTFTDRMVDLLSHLVPDDEEEVPITTTTKIEPISSPQPPAAPPQTRAPESL